ncbi:protein FAR1-RELATED SEQUENCE 12-like isoform X2, partial [Fagus crenata]
TTNHNLIPEHSSSNNIPSSSSPDLTSTSNLENPLPAATMESLLEILASNVADTSNSLGGVAEKNLPRDHAKKSTNHNLIPEHSSSNNIPSPSSPDLTSTPNLENPLQAATMESELVPLEILTSNVADTSNSPGGVAEENLPREHAKKNTNNNLIPEHSISNNIPSSSTPDSTSTPNLLPLFPVNTRELEPPLEISASHVGDTSKSPQGFAKENLLGEHAKETPASNLLRLFSVPIAIDNISEGNREVKSHVPEIGMTFSSMDDVYKFYQNYAAKMGFKVRIGKGQKLGNEIVKKKTYLCSKEGHRAMTQYAKMTKYRRKETRTGCNAQLQIALKNDKYEIVKFEAEHNHELQESTQRHCIDSDSEILEAETLNQPTHENEAAKTVEAAHASPCDMNYSKPLGHKNMNNLQSKDAQGLINYLNQLRVEDPSLFNKIQLDVECQVTNFFWSDGSAKFSNANFFQNSKSKPMTLPEYGQIYKEAAEQHRKKELDEDNSCDAREPELISDSLMLKQASDKYTRTMFKIFQKNLLGIISVPLEVITSNDEIVKFKVTEGEKTENIVEFKISDSTTTCSCELFESVGILCVHALKVLNAMNIFQIPQQHILKRWTKSARDGVEEDDNGKEITDESYRRLRKRKFERL